MALDYTDGEWVLIERNMDIWSKWDLENETDNGPIAVLTDNAKLGDGHLIASAPDMLEALMSIAKSEHSYCTSYGNCECAGVAEKALIKAGFIGEGEL